MSTDLLETQWVLLWNRFGAQGDGRGVFALLRERYTQPERTFHNLGRVADRLDAFREVKDVLAHPDHVEMAIWFSELVVGIEDKNPKVASIKFARNALAQAKVAPNLLACVEKLIRATDLHATATTASERFLADIDMRIFGCTTAQFNECEKLLGKEYSRLFPKDVYASFRFRVVEEILARPHIYHTHSFQKMYEGRARDNLVRLRKTLAQERIT